MGEKPKAEEGGTITVFVDNESNFLTIKEVQ